MPLVKVVDAVKTYRVNDLTVRGLDGFSLELNAGEVCGLVGVSGSGKSTLLHAIASLVSLDSGMICVDGIDLSDLDMAARARYRSRVVSLVFQEYNLLPMLTAVENVALAGYLAEKPSAHARRIAAETLAVLNLGSFLERYPAELSGGQRQRVAIARALAGREIAGKKVLIADEPTGSLDRQTTQEVLAALRTAAEEGLAVLVSTHDPLVMEHCDRVVTIRDGRNDMVESSS